MPWCSLCLPWHSHHRTAASGSKHLFASSCGRLLERRAADAAASSHAQGGAPPPAAATPSASQGGRQDSSCGAEHKSASRKRTGFSQGVEGASKCNAMERWKRGVRLGDDHQARRHVHTLPERGGISPWPSQEGDRCRTTGGEMCVATKDTRVFRPSQHAPTQLTHHIFMW